MYLEPPLAGPPASVLSLRFISSIASDSPARPLPALTLMEQLSELVIPPAGWAILKMSPESRPGPSEMEPFSSTPTPIGIQPWTVQRHKKHCKIIAKIILMSTYHWLWDEPLCSWCLFRWCDRQRPPHCDHSQHQIRRSGAGWGLEVGIHIIITGGRTLGGQNREVNFWIKRAFLKVSFSYFWRYPWTSAPSTAHDSVFVSL